MSWGRASRRGVRLRAGVAIWWDAVSGGRFFTVWSAVVALPLSTVVLAPYASVDTPFELVTAQASALLVAAALMAALLPVALAERRMSSPAACGVLVLTALMTAAVVRPFLNDVLAVGVFGLGPDPAWAERIVTNVVAWVSVLSLVAVTEQLYASSQAARGRLVVALQAVTDEQRRAGHYEQESADFLATEIAALREALSALVAAPLDFERVRVFADGVRSVSHRARDRAGMMLADLHPVRSAPPASSAARSFFERLRPPAAGLVGVIFAAGSAPFALRSGGPALAVLVTVGVVALCFGADLVSRRLSRGSSAQRRGVRLVAVWVVAGLVATAAAVVIVGGRTPVPLITIVSLPGVAVIAALCADAVHRGRVESRQLGQALRTVVRSAAEQASGARRDLLHASEVLHGRVQGSCVMLAAQVDDESATPDDIRAFELAIGAGLSDALESRASAVSRAADLAETVAVWKPVLSVSSNVDPMAATAMADALVSTRVVAVVAEGLVNAVKHAAARSAAVDVRGAAGGSGLAVQVRTPGRLRGDSRGPGLGVAGLGPSARVFQSGDDVVLEAFVPTVASTPVAVGQGRGALHDSDSM